MESGQVSLQGELGAFGVEDVLRLVGAKVGTLVFEHPHGAVVQLHLCHGLLTGADDGSSTEIAEVLCRLLRNPVGSFAFIDGDDIPDGPGLDIEAATRQARALEQEWLDVETSIPSPDALLTLVPTAPRTEVRLTPEQWVAVARVAGGAVARTVATTLAETLLGGLQQLKPLVDSGLLEVGEVPAPPAIAVEQPAAAPIAVDLRDVITVPDPDRGTVTEEAPADVADVRLDAELEAVAEERDASVIEVAQALIARAEPEPEPAPEPEIAVSEAEAHEPVYDLSTEVLDRPPLPEPSLTATFDDADARKALLGTGNMQLSRPEATVDNRVLPALGSFESTAGVSSSVESLARVLDAVHDSRPTAGSLATGPDDDRVALLKELEALREGLRGPRALLGESPPIPATPANPVTKPAKAEKVGADTLRSKRR